MIVNDWPGLPPDPPPPPQAAIMPSRTITAVHAQAVATLDTLNLFFIGPYRNNMVENNERISHAILFPAAFGIVNRECGRPALAGTATLRDTFVPAGVGVAGLGAN